MAAGDVRDLGARRAVAQMERADLEDKQLKLMEENLLLKKHIQSQEEKMKRMATKLLKLAADDRRDVVATRPAAATGGHRLRDVETEEMIDNMQTKLQDLEQENSMLKNKVLVMKHQMEVTTRRPNVYSHVGPRTDSGLVRKGKSTSDGATKRLVGPAAMAKYGHSLLEEARRDNQKLEEMLLELKNELAAMQAKLELQQQEFRQKELVYEQDKLKLQEQYEIQLSHIKRGNIKEDVELIKVQRELRDKGNKLTSLQSQFLVAEKNMSKMKSSYSQVLQQMEQLNDKLKQEQLATSQLQSELHTNKVDQRAISELQQVIDDLKTDKTLLQANNEKLIKAAFHNEKDQHHKLQLQSLQDRITQLETTSQSCLRDKTQLLDRLSVERELSEKLDNELRELKMSCELLKEQNGDLQRKISFFIKESSVDWDEVEKAVAVVKAKPQVVSVAISTDEPVVVQDDTKVQLEMELAQLRQTHSDMLGELDKHKKLLSIQQNITDQYKKEVVMVNKRMVTTQLDCDVKLKETTKMVDIKTSRIKQLEGQLHNIAYGTRSCNINLETAATSDLDHDELGRVELQRGQNVFFFTVTMVTLSAEMIKLLHTTTPSLFVTYGFYDFALSITPVMEGTRPVFDHTSQYVTEVDDSFIKYLKKNQMTLELHQAFGTDHKTIGACQVKFRDIIHTSGDKLYCTAALIGGGSVTEVGSIDYWMMLKLPITKSARLRQGRSKAQQLLEEYPTHQQQPISNTVTLSVTIVGCNGLTARMKGHVPSPYVVYKFYTNDDHDSDIVVDTTSPRFDDVKLYTVPADSCLHDYLCRESLEVFVFDDKDPEDTYYMGLASVSLLPLAHNHTIQGCYQLVTETGGSNGTVEVTLKWTNSYTSSQPTPPLLTEAVYTANKNTDQVTSHSSLHNHTLSDGQSCTTKDDKNHTPSVDHNGTPKDDCSQTTKDDQSFTPKSHSPTDRLSPIPKDDHSHTPMDDQSHTPTDDQSHTPQDMQSDISSTPPSLTPVTSQQDMGEHQSPEDGQQQLLPEHLTAASSGDDSVSEELESSGDEDTMFEETSHSPITPLMSSGQSGAHHDDTTLRHDDTVPKFGGLQDLPTAQLTSSHPSAEEEEEEDGTSDEEDSNPVTSTPLVEPSRPGQPAVQVAILTITIHSFTMQSTPASVDMTTQHMFVEYDLMGLHYDELETSSQPLPLPGHSCNFDSTHSFKIEADLRKHLLSSLSGGNSDDMLITFTVVSDPIEGDTNAECVEFGTAQLDLRQILSRGRDASMEKLEVMDPDDEDDLVGHLTITITALHALTTLSHQQ
ncbi:protein fantom-like isoform X2 [Dysidea avara]|uniref:protein fantom-like isoform X2 n=1 Tax=Dysidea avara TaxID=196820 RepID=UPI003333CF2F